MSLLTDVARLPTPAPRFAALRRFRRGDFPLLPVLILGTIAFVAIFAEYLAPHNPEVGMLTARFKPPFWMARGSYEYLLGTDQLGRDVLSRLIFGARVSMIVGIRRSRRRHHRHDAWPDRRLSRRLGRSGRDAADRYLAGAAVADLRDLSRGDRRPQHVEHRHHPRRRLLDAIRAG